MKYQIFSDVSFARGKMSYAGIVAYKGEIVEKVTGRIEGETRSSIAEVIASSRVLASVPSGSKIELFTDIAPLARTLNCIHASSVRSCSFRSAINGLLRELSRMSGFSAKLVRRSSKFYKMCHDAAYRECRPDRYDTWQCWRHQKRCAPPKIPKRATYSIAPILADALRGCEVPA